MRKVLVSALVVALAVGAASPAFGAPSPLSVAKKALRLAGKADKRARTADANAQTALEGPPTVHVSSGEVSASPNDFARFDVKCPSGYAPAGFAAGLGALELVAALVGPDGYLGSYFNPSSSRSFSGTLDVVCVKGRWEPSPRLTKRLSRQSALSRLDELEGARRAR